MDKLNLQALKDSISKWEKNTRVRKPENIKYEDADCPLCQAANTRNKSSSGPSCVGCPVMVRTGSPNCDGTPYYRARSAAHGWMDRPSSLVAKHDFMVAAQAEVDYLKVLLPEGEIA